MQRLQGRLNRLLSNHSITSSSEFPPMNIWTCETGAVLRTEIPGISSEDVEISLVHDTLTIKGQRRPENLKEGESCHRNERGCGQFTRSIQLPFAVEVDKVEARFADGVLQITLPRAEAEKPRKINVVAQ
jgi:HSP20 family protein